MGKLMYLFNQKLLDIGIFNMTYAITYTLLDAKGNQLERFVKAACFSAYVNRCPSPNTAFILYDFNNMKVTKLQATKYFRFLKTIPEFQYVFEGNTIKGMVDTKLYKIDVRKHNGLKVFVALTLVRAVVEEWDIVKTIAQFSTKFKYSISNLAILKAVGSVHKRNCGHWLTCSVDKKNIAKEFNPSYLDVWNAAPNFANTGLISKINLTFQHQGDGYAPNQPITKPMVEEIAKENMAYYNKATGAKIKREVVTKKAETKELILDF
jgi:hypothetical protein